MIRPTTKDLAKAAGVSLATVDRVLNERPNVSRKTVEKVQEAIDRIGFVRNMAAVNLARNTSYRFKFILPDTGDQFLDVIKREVTVANEAMRSDSVEVSIARMPIEDAHQVANYLTGLTTDKVSGIAIMAPESPQVRDACLRLRERGIEVVDFLSGRSSESEGDVIGINNRAAGATAGRLIGKFSCNRKGKVLIVAETLRARDSIERRLGFDAVVNEDFSHLTPLPSLETHADPGRAARVIERTLQNNDDVVAVYIMSSEARIPLSIIRDHPNLDRPITVVHERTEFNISALLEDRIDAIIAQNAGHAVRSAIRVLRARIDNRETVASQDTLRIEILLKENL